MYSLALCLSSFYSRRHACLKPIAGNAAIGRFQCHVQMLSSVVQTDEDIASRGTNFRLSLIQHMKTAVSYVYSDSPAHD